MTSSSPTTLDAHSPAARYLGLEADLVDRLRTTEGANILAAARIIADALVAQRTIHIFGTGHSHMLAEELYYRAGGLVNVKPLLFDGLMLHTSAPRLHELATVVIDNGGAVGDAAVDIAGLGSRVSATSTVVGATILNAVMAEAIQLSVDAGVIPDIYESSNTSSGDVSNHRFIGRTTTP